MIINGDSFEELKKLEDNSVDSIVTDPPYDIGFMNKKWDKKSLITNVDFWKECLRVLKPGGHLLSFGHSRTSHRMVIAVEDAGFEIRDTIMWMYGSGFPKSHNVAIAIDKKLGKMGHRGKEFDTGAKDAYDKPKRKMEGVEQHQAISDEAKEWQGWGTALKPAYEPIVMARKPLAEKNVAENVMKWGTGGINIDDSRVETTGEDFSKVKGRAIKKLTNNRTDEESLNGPKQQEALRKLKELGRFPANIILDKEAGQHLDEQSGPTKASFVRNKTDGARPFNNEGEATNYTSEKINVEEDGKGASRYFKSIDTELCASIEQQEHKEPQPNCEPIVVARKPLAEKTVADNVLKHGTGAINIGDSRIGEEKIITNGKGNKFVENNPHGQRTGESVLGVNKENVGRFPANVILDEQAGEVLDEQAPKVGSLFSAKRKKDTTGGSGDSWTNGGNKAGEDNGFYDGLGGASRFFYCPKVSTKERNLNCDSLKDKEWDKEGAAIPERANRPFKPSKNNHPTVKPIKLMEYLVRLVTKKGGVVLDPFAGSGSTGVACKNLGMNYIMIEREEEYCEIIRARLS
jgi:site-specific DNA-methyltransferase (adenine-specific)